MPYAVHGELSIRPTRLGHGHAKVMKDLVEVRQEWRNRWPFEDAAAVAIQSIEMAVTSAVIQKTLAGLWWQQGIG